jgi:hypothetical protein
LSCRVLFFLCCFRRLFVVLFVCLSFRLSVFSSVSSSAIVYARKRKVRLPDLRDGSCNEKVRCLYVSLCVCLSVVFICVSICLSLCLPVCLFVSICVSVGSIFYLSCLFYLSLFCFCFVYLSVCLSVCLIDWLAVCQSV